MSPKSQMAKALSRGLELLRKAGKSPGVPESLCLRSPAPRELSTEPCRGFPSVLAPLLLPAGSVPPPPRVSFLRLLKAKCFAAHKPPDPCRCSCSDAHSPTHGSALPAHFQLPRPVSPLFMANTIGEEKNPHFPDPVVQPHSPVGFGSC